jgi:hypothetical protein
VRRLNPDGLRTCHSPSDLAGLLVRIAPRCAQQNLAQSAWRPCLCCLRYKSTRLRSWRKVSFNTPYTRNRYPFSYMCIQNAVLSWCNHKANECPMCHLRAFNTIKCPDPQDPRFGRMVNACKACDWCKPPAEDSDHDAADYHGISTRKPPRLATPHEHTTTSQCL